MECLSEKGSSGQSNHARRSTKLGDRLMMFEKPEESYANINRDTLGNVGMVPPKPANLRRKKHSEKKSNDDEELVRYMSSLPSYLQRGKNPQEKAFNVGVLDWKHLESWRSNKHKQIPSRTSGFSPSSSNNTSSFSSTEESSSNSSSGHSCSVPSTSDKADARNRSTTTPLRRRLLEPFLKPKMGISGNFAGSMPQGDSTSRDKHSKSAPRRGESLTPYMMKVKLDLKGCKTIEIGDPCPAGRRGPSTMRALLQVAIKNSVPLFKFAVENEGSVIAATMKRLTSSTKEKNNWIYTFFTIQEMKKKDRNLSNQGGKDRSHGYISSVIAEMKFSDTISQKSIIREFVLFTTGIKQPGQQTADLQLTDELAAIVVKFSHKGTKNLHSSQQVVKSINIQESDSSEAIEFGVCSKTRDVSMNVILPGGNHGLPRKGEPSSLIERWKSGGSCDCGGWDLGCKVRILANHNGMSMESSSTDVPLSAGQFELFSQGEDQENKPALKLCPFKDGIFSVEYTSSLKILQAFSISLAVLNIRKQDGFLESKNAFGEDSSQATMLSNVSDKAQVEFPAKRVSIPSLSPVGRV